MAKQNKDLSINYILKLKELKKLIAISQVKMVSSANAQMLWLYWNIGNLISENESNSLNLIEELSKDLRKKFPKIKGFSSRNLLYMKKFAETYPVEVIMSFNNLWNQILKNPKKLQEKNIIDNDIHSTKQNPSLFISEQEFIQSFIAQFTWEHHLVLMNKTKDYTRKFWYMLNTLEHGISKNILFLLIDAKVFENQLKTKKISTYKNTTPPVNSDFANYLLKDSFIFDLAQAKEKADERSIYEQLEKHTIKFLLESKQGFAYIGSQVHFEIGETDQYLDLLFYHLKMRCYFVILLRAREFDPGDTGSLGFFINVVNDKLKSEYDNNTNGLIICKGASKIVAEYSLSGYKLPMGITDYTTSKIVPDELKSDLPSIEEIEKELMNEPD